MKQQLHRVRGRSLEKALEQVKIRFGPEALIQDTREVEVRRENSLGMEKVFEVTVIEGESADAGAEVYTARDSFPGPGSGITGEEIDLISRLRNQVNEVNRLSGACQAIKKRLARSLSGRDDYPIYDLLVEKGVFVNIVNMIMAEYFGQPGSGEEKSAENALSHIRRNLRTVEDCSWDQIGGVHFFIGSAGSGKTTIVTKLAGRLAERAEKTKVISLFPRNLRDLGGYEIFDRTEEVEVVVARNLRELEQLLSSWRGERVFIDTPCVLSSRRMTSRRFRNFIRDQETAHVNYIFDVSAGPARIERELEVFDRMYG
ncbi:MAG: hypothetical protein GF417_08610, partial [Candidatus Latescibacteria bacterium]|nr:hypothetical protein [Candidatus Latescibacterota bacterium]